MPWSEEREADLRASGWSDCEVRDYKRGYLEAADRHDGARMRVPAAPVYPQPQQLIPDQLRVLPRGDRGTWYRSTVAGQLAAVVAPPAADEEAREQQAARAFIEDYEWRYGRKPGMTEARYAVRPRGGEGVMLSGRADEIAQVFRTAGLPFEIVTRTEPLPSGPANTITQPVTRG